MIHNSVENRLVNVYYFVVGFFPPLPTPLWQHHIPTTAFFLSKVNHIIFSIAVFFFLRHLTINIELFSNELCGNGTIFYRDFFSFSFSCVTAIKRWQWPSFRISANNFDYFFFSRSRLILRNPRFWLDSKFISLTDKSDRNLQCICAIANI